MNFILSLNKKYVLFVASVILFVFIIFLFLKYVSLEKELVRNINIISNVDITEPRFAINNSNNKILVTAEEGNFLEKDKILLNKNVIFKSKDFIIKTEKVVFNRKDQTAESLTKSIFKSKNTKISSDGFNIYDNGNKIKFIGNAVVILK